jgi:hypothetical protein
MGMLSRLRLIRIRMCRAGAGLLRCRQAIAPLIRAVFVEKSVIALSIAIPLGTQGRPGF